MSSMLIDGRFVAVFPRLVRALEGDTTGAAVLQAIHYRTQGPDARGGWIPLPLVDIAEEIGLSRDQAQRATVRLRNLGLLLMRGDKGASLEWAIDYEQVEALQGGDAKSRDPQQVTRNRVTTDAKSRDPRREIASLSLYTEDKEVIEQTPDGAVESEGKRANRLAKHYSDRVPMCRFPAIAQIVKTAVRAGHDDQAIVDALLRLADDGRSVTVETLRVELEGRGHRASGSELYARAARRLAQEPDAAILRAVEASGGAG